MLRILAVAALGLGLAGCVSPQQRVASDDAACRQMGAKPGTDIYVQCRMFQQQKRDDADESFRNRMAVLSATLNQQPARLQTNCTSYRTGMYVNTNCY